MRDDLVAEVHSARRSVGMISDGDHDARCLDAEAHRQLC
jgi:hypothetical protein